MNHEDQLIDALLKEQAKGRDADTELLASIDEAIDRSQRAGKPAWRRALPLGIAAALALGAAGIYHWQRDVSEELAVNERPPATLDRAEGRMQVVDETGVAHPTRSLQADSAPAEMGLLMEAEMTKFQEMEMAEVPVPAEETVGQPPADMRRPMAPSSSAARQVEADEFGAGALVEFGDFAAGEGMMRTRKSDGFGRSRGQDAAADLDRENYGRLTDPAWQSPWAAPLSTFSIDVDTASYTNVRRMITDGRPVPADAVRIEELVNYFDYGYEPPAGDESFALRPTLATCPWAPEHLLARVAIEGREIENAARPASNLMFLIDVSGSMQAADKLGLLKQSMTVLVDQLDERDRVGIVVYAGTEGLVLPPTRLDEDGKSAALQAIGKLEAGGSTNGGAGISRAYELAAANRTDDGVNRVILATDGDFNVGVTGEGELVSLVKDGADDGVSLTVLGFGGGNLNDAMLEAISNEGNGNYFYIDRESEAERVFLQQLTGTLVTIAKDVKIQVEFNPGKVKAYRLIGYANRVLADRDFNDDKVDAGDIGAGHTVTAFYEIVPDGVEMPAVGDIDELRYQRPEGRGELVGSDDWFTLKLRHKAPEGETSKLIEMAVDGQPVAWDEAGNDFRMAAAVAMFGMKLRGMDELAGTDWAEIEAMARPALAEDPQEQRAEFLELLELLD